MQQAAQGDEDLLAALLRVTEDLVGLSKLLEAMCGVWISRVLVWMTLGEAPSS